MCEYCSGEKALFDNRTEYSKKGDFYPGIEVWIGSGGISVAAATDTYEPGYEEAAFKIHFCPMCGARLGDENNQARQEAGAGRHHKKI